MSMEALLQERLDRIEKAINLEPVDRIPVIYMGVAFSPRFMGMKISQFCSDAEAAVGVTIAAMERLGDLDGINLPPLGRPGIGFSASWMSRVELPGRELPEDSLWQVREAEVMTVEDYDTIIEKGWPAFFASYMPRVVDMAEFGANAAWIRTNFPDVVEKFHDHGFGVVAAGMRQIPFETLCGARSMQQFMLDLYRRPEKVKAAMDVMLPDVIQGAIAAGRSTVVPRIWLGGFRSASAIVSPKIWERFVFPYLHQLVTALAESGIISVLHFDQDWTRDLPRLRELPAKKCVLNLDGMTDVRKVKQVLGDRIAVLGDVPSSLFATGTPDDIYRYVRDLVRDVGPTGLLLCPGCDAPLNTKPENMEAFVAASHEFGRVA